MKNYKLLDEVVPVVRSDAATFPLQEMTVKEQLEAWIALDTVEKALAKRKEALRDSLLKYVQSNGVTNDKGHQEVVLDETKVVREKRTAKQPGVEPLAALCAEKKVPKKKLPFDVVETLVVNQSKLDSLVSLGSLQESQIKDICNVTYALQVEQGEEVKQHVKDLKEVGTVYATEMASTPVAKAG